MSKKFLHTVQAIVLSLIFTTACPGLHAQAPPSLQDQLAAQYPYASGTNGCNVGNPDTALVTQKAGGGMRVLPVNSSVTIAKCTNRFVDGVLKPPSSACNGEAVGKVGGFMSHVPKVGGAFGSGSSKVNDQAANQQLSVVKVGDTIYPTKLEVNEGKGEIKLSIMTCQQSDNQQNPYKGEIVFQFSKDTLKPENVSKIEDTIALVFAPGTGDQQSQGGQQNQNGAQQSQDNQQNQGDRQTQNSAPQNNQAPGCNVEMGQTVAQVETMCGKPVNQSKGATKLLYFYDQPKMKVIFVNGKVSDIE